MTQMHNLGEQVFVFVVIPKPLGVRPQETCSAHKTQLSHHCHSVITHKSFVQLSSFQDPASMGFCPGSQGKSVSENRQCYCISVSLKHWGKRWHDL